MSLLKSPLLRQAIAIVIAVSLGAFYGSKIEFNKQWPMFEALRTTAGIIFGVLGAWLAIIYPRAFSHATDNEIEREVIKAEKVLAAKLLAPIRYSTAVLAVVLLIGVAVPILQQIQSLMNHPHVMRAVGFGLLAYLTMVQLWTLFLTLFPAEGVRDRLTKSIAHAEIVEEYVSQSRKSAIKK